MIVFIIACDKSIHHWSPGMVIHWGGGTVPQPARAAKCAADRWNFLCLPSCPLDPQQRPVLIPLRGLLSWKIRNLREHSGSHMRQTSNNAESFSTHVLCSPRICMEARALECLPKLCLGKRGIFGCWPTVTQLYVADRCLAVRYQMYQHIYIYIYQHHWFPNPPIKFADRLRIRKLRTENDDQEAVPRPSMNFFQQWSGFRVSLQSGCSSPNKS